MVSLTLFLMQNNYKKFKDTKAQYILYYSFFQYLIHELFLYLIIGQFLIIILELN